MTEKEYFTEKADEALTCLAANADSMKSAVRDVELSALRLFACAARNDGEKMPYDVGYEVKSIQRGANMLMLIVSDLCCSFGRYQAYMSEAEQSGEGEWVDKSERSS